MAIYHSICTFANDFEDLGGGYILVGVDTDENGAAKRPMGGVPEEQIDNILQDMIGYNAKFGPYYMPRTSIEEVDGKIQNPSNFRERTFKESVPQIVQQTMTGQNEFKRCMKNSF